MFNFQYKLTFSGRIKISVIFFILSALYGLLLRLYKIVDFIPVVYKHFLQGHSHVAFLGWGFLAVITLIDSIFLNHHVNSSKLLKRLFILMTFSIGGLLISFPLQGYRFFSILFLSVFLISSYFYLWKILSLFKNKTCIASKFIKSGILFYFLSSIAIWSIGFISIKFGKQALYHNAIYFYLHFLYNGFFVFTLFGLFFQFITNNNIQVKQIHIKRFYQLTLITCIPAYSLSLLWNDMPTYIYLIGFTTAFFQLISLFYLLHVIKKVYQYLKSRFFKFLLLFVITSFYLKVLLQFVSVFPYFMQKALILKSYFIIGYLHLFTLGFMSLFIILLLILSKINLTLSAIKLIILGVFLSEFLLFLQGGLALSSKNIPFFDTLLLFASFLINVGVLFLFKMKSFISSPSINDKI